MRQHGLSLVLVLLAGSGAPIQALRQVVWTATTRQSLTAPPAFQQWFADDPAVPAQVLSAADALSDITALGENRFEARMSTTQFPFVTLQPMVILSCDRSADGTEVVVSAQPPFLHVTRGVRFDLKSSRWKFLGPRDENRACGMRHLPPAYHRPPRAPAQAASMMDSQSSTRYWLEDENGQLTCEATVVASFKVPRWVPVPLNVVQNAGQASVTAQVETDTKKTLENLLLNFQTTTTEGASLDRAAVQQGVSV